MQIRIKTYDEVRENRVSVEVPDGQRFDIELDGEYRITNQKINSSASIHAEELGRSSLDWTALRADRDQLRESLTSIKADVHGTGGVWDRLHKSNEKVSEMQVQVQELTAKLDAAELGRTANREWAERAEARLQKIRRVVRSEHAKADVELAATSVSSRLAQRIKQIREIVGPAN